MKNIKKKVVQSQIKNRSQKMVLQSPPSEASEQALAIDDWSEQIQLLQQQKYSTVDEALNALIDQVVALRHKDISSEAKGELKEFLQELLAGNDVILSTLQESVVKK